MFSVNKVPYGQPVCNIKGGDYDGLTVYLIPPEKEKEHMEDATKRKYADFSELTLEGDSEFIPASNDKSSREVVCALARSGAGKSYFCADYIKDYHERNPTHPVFWISPFEDDKELSKLDFMIFLKIDDDYLKAPIVLDSFPQDSLILIDDLDVLEVSADVKKSISGKDGLVSKILKGGRHRNLSLVYTEHELSTSSKLLRDLVNESHLIVMYLQSAGNYETIMRSYLGLNAKEYNVVKRLNSRWVAIRALHPAILYTQKRLCFKKNIIHEKAEK